MAENKRISWIDCSKFVATIAVLINHTYNVLYTNQIVLEASNFCVSLFVLLLGITSYISAEKYIELGGLKFFLKKLRTIIPAYCIATFIYEFAARREFSLSDYFDLLLHFNASGPLYYVALYISLMLVFWPLYKLVYLCEKNCKGYIFEIFILIISAVFAVFSIRYTNIFEIYGGGGNLFGGTYIILLYVGMLLAKHVPLEEGTKDLLFLIIGFLLFIIWLGIEYFYRQSIDGMFPFGEGFNPPGMCLMLSAIFMLIFTKGMTGILLKNPLTEKCVSIFKAAGSHSLYIFLYHRLFLDYFLIPYVNFRNRLLKIFLYFSVMIIGSIFTEIIIKYLIGKIKTLYLPLKS